MLWAPQVPLVMRETFGEVPGPGTSAPNWIWATPAPAQIWEPETAKDGPDGPRGSNGASNWGVKF